MSFAAYKRQDLYEGLTVHLAPDFRDGEDTIFNGHHLDAVGHYEVMVTAERVFVAPVTVTSRTQGSDLWHALNYGMGLMERMHRGEGLEDIPDAREFLDARSSAGLTE